MKKKKSIIFRIICLLMLCIFPALALLSGCDENAELDDFEESDPETITSSSLYGTKVLYRPDDYNYDEGSGATDGGTNDYYGAYAWNIINHLYYIFEIADQRYLYGSTEDDIQADHPNFFQDNIPYLYDSMRYQVNTVGTVTSRQIVNKSSISDEDLTISQDLPQQYQIVGADISLAWNWGAPYDMKWINVGEDTVNTNAYLTYESGMSLNVLYLTNVIINDTIFAPYDLSGEAVFKDRVGAYYSNNTFTAASESLMNYYLGTDDETNYEEYSDFVKVLEYAIYCYAVDLEPAEVRVTFATDGAPNVQVTGYDSVDSALERAKENFQILGSFVGLADRQIEKIEAWVLDNIIGEDVVDNADYFYTYSNVTEVVTVDENGEYSYSYEFDTMSSRIELGRDYEGTVANIIQNVCSEVSIGNDGGSDVTIDQRFPASEVMEYAGVANNVYSDKSFAVPGQENSADKIRPYEYQSIVFMVKEEVSVDGVGIALKYDSGLDGTTEGVYGEEYLDIIVDLNYYNNATDTLTVLESMQVRVYDGPWDQENVYWDWPDGTGGKSMDAEETGAPEDHYSGIYFGGVDIELGAFKTDIGDGVLMTDVGKNGYSASLLISEDPLVLVGTTDVRKYYEIVEPGSSELDNEQIPDGYTYLSGRFNSDMFSGAEGCDYLEVTFKVLKQKGDTTPNRYKFYAGALWGGLTDTGPDYD